MELKARFKQAREQMGLSQHQLAEQTHASQMKISKIEQGLTLQPRHLEIFAQTLNVSVEWLLFGLNPPRWAKTAQTDSSTLLGYYREVPIITWQHIEQMNDRESADLANIEHIICPIPHISPQTFALPVIGDSMAAPYGRSYPEGMLIFVDPTQPVMPGQRVIAKTDKGYTFKELAENEFAELYLRPLNPNPAYQPIFGEQIAIYGVVIGGFQAE